MKKFVAVIALFALVITFSTACAEIYPQTFIVSATDTTQDALVLIDGTGNEWVWYGIEDYEVGDIVAAIMDDNGTEIIYDDAIITMRYTGYAEGWE